MGPSDIRGLFEEVRRGIIAPLRPAMETQAADDGLEDRDSYLLAVSLDFEPETTSVAKLAVRNPYVARHSLEAGLAKLAEQRLLEPAGADEYRITSAGHAAMRRSNEVFSLLDALEPLPRADVERSASLLLRLVEACLAAPEPLEKPCIAYNRHSDPGAQAAPLFRILQYVSDLNAFRDDAHLSAWRSLGVSGPAWEAFTFLWHGEAHTADELAAKLPNRQHTSADYASALRALAQRGWIEPSAGAGGSFQLTGRGKALREKVEDATDRVYYAPWSCFNDAERDELGDLLVRLREALNEMTRTAAPGA